MDSPNTVQLVFYVVSPLATFLAVATAYLALAKQSRPLVLIYYEPADFGSAIDIVICNHGNGAARNINFSEPIPIHCWGIEKPSDISKDGFVSFTIPVLAPGQELRYDGGQYAGITSVIGDRKEISAKYEYKSPLKIRKKGADTSVLDIRYMQKMSSRNSVRQDISDAMQGNNNTIFAKINKNLEKVSQSLLAISKYLNQKIEK